MKNIDETEKILYDTIGNPTTYRNATMSWFGRQLTKYSKGSVTASFTYDASGLRGTKTVNGTDTIYQYIGDKLYYEKRGKKQEFYYFYDSYGKLSAIYYNFKSPTTGKSSSAVYFVTTNSQGDVIGLYNNKGVKVAAYEYDAWGNILSVKDSTGKTITNQDHIANANPFRYRGYYYDAETGFYLTGTRYYDPEIGRFINADGEISDLGGNVLGYNLFAYCFNNPVNMDDPTGQWPKWVGKAIAVVAVAAVVVAAVAVTVSTFGAGSVAGVAAISAAVTIAARATEVAVLQVKKSKNSTQNTGGKTSGNNSSNGGNGSGGGGSNTQKSNGQVAVDVTEALFDNGVQIMGITPYTKAGSIGFNHILNQQVSKIFGETTTLRSTLSATGGKVVPYAFAAYAWCKTTISIFSDDPVQRAEQRGYTLK